MAVDEQILEAQRSCMETLQMAGQLIVENGGEIFRVEETITRMGRAFGLQEVEAFAVPSGMFISYRLCDGDVESSVKRLRSGPTFLARVDAVNAVSRRVEAGELTCEQAHRELDAIRRMKPLSGLMLVLAAGLCAAGFSFLFGGGWMEFLVAGAVAALSQWLTDLLSRTRVNGTMLIILGGLLSALLPTVVWLMVPSLRTEAAVAGALMPLVPGLTMTNAVQDTVRGDVIAGVRHGLQALFTACAVAGGAMLASALFRTVTGSGLEGALENTDPGLGGLQVLLLALGAFLGSLGFAVLVQTPRRSWIPASLIGMGAYMVCFLLGELGLPNAAAIFCGTMAGSLSAMLCARRMKMISTIFMMLSIVPFVPGLGLYRCMHYLGGGFTTLGARAGIVAMTTIAMIVIGQGVGSFLYRSLTKKQ